MSDDAKKMDEVLEEEVIEETSSEETEEPQTEGEAQAEETAEEKATSPEDEALNERYLRLMADFQNFKRRTEKEKSDIYAFANEKLIGELLNVIDNFERALAAGNAEDNFYKGMEMILKQLLGVIEKAGASEIKALGEDFDPNFHNAIMMEDSSEYESGKVTGVLQKGYVLNNKVIRPAMVKVAN
ncbi:MAG: nucleotide exchange factor GrpE [Firmicutes bacterium]|nr:nucleotide exchange factor GrpE [Bacillota bacterium]